MRTFVVSFLDRRGLPVRTLPYFALKRGAAVDFARTAIMSGTIKGASRFQVVEA